MDNNGQAWRPNDSCCTKGGPCARRAIWLLTGNEEMALPGPRMNHPPPKTEKMNRSKPKTKFSKSQMEGLSVADRHLDVKHVHPNPVALGMLQGHTKAPGSEAVHLFLHEVPKPAPLLGLAQTFGPVFGSFLFFCVGRVRKRRAGFSHAENGSRVRMLEI